MESRAAVAREATLERGYEVIIRRKSLVAVAGSFCCRAIQASMKRVSGSVAESGWFWRSSLMVEMAWPG